MYVIYSLLTRFIKDMGFIKFDKLVLVNPFLFWPHSVYKLHILYVLKLMNH